MPISSRFTIRFNQTQSAAAVHITHDEAPSKVLSALELPAYNGIVVIHGGASNMEAELLTAVRRFLIAGLVPLAEEHHLLLADGGTQSGVSQLLGESRYVIRGTFPLLGVAPTRYVTYPGGPAMNAEHVPLNEAHSHFILVDDGEFGIESTLLVGLLQQGSQNGVALIINGGEIVLKEALAHASQGNTLVTLGGSGRVADKLADPTSPESQQLPPSAHLHVTDIRAPQTFITLLKHLLFNPPA